MPTVLRQGPYRFYFYSNEADEPVHVHVERDRDVAQLRLDPDRVQRKGGFGRAEILRISRLVNENQSRITDTWYE